MFRFIFLLIFVICTDCYGMDVDWKHPFTPPPNTSSTRLYEAATKYNLQHRRWYSYEDIPKEEVERMPRFIREMYEGCKNSGLKWDKGGHLAPKPQLYFQDKLDPILGAYFITKEENDFLIDDDFRFQIAMNHIMQQGIGARVMHYYKGRKINNYIDKTPIAYDLYVEAYLGFPIKAYMPATEAALNRYVNDILNICMNRKNKTRSLKGMLYKFNEKAYRKDFERVVKYYKSDRTPYNVAMDDVPNPPSTIKVDNVIISKHGSYEDVGQTPMVYTPVKPYLEITVRSK